MSIDTTADDNERTTYLKTQIKIDARTLCKRSSLLFEFTVVK